MIKKKCVGIDFHVFDGLFQGSRTHVLELFKEMIRISPDIQFILFLDNIKILKTISPIFNAPNVSLVYMPTSNPFKRLCWQLPIMQKKYSLDILHTQYIIPIPSFCFCFVTIHDLLFETHPQFFNFFFKIRSTILVRLSAWFALHIFTVSEYSKKQIMLKYKISPSKISIIYNGVDNNKYYPGNYGNKIINQKLLFSKKYILSVGRLEPRKNYVTLLYAYARLCNNTMPLVIIGQPHFAYSRIYEVIDELGLESRVHIFSDINDNELPAFYRHSKLFIYLTLAEGFGMPPLEAMASGVPVISSNTTSIPEVLGDAALLVNPNDVDEIAKSIDNLLINPSFYKKMQKRGLRQAKNFHWKKAAKIVRMIYLDSLNKIS
jgi:glycosyltransferase involved in cell wall biosynthesis